MIPLLLAFLSPPVAPPPFAALERYNGYWSIHASHPLSGHGSGPDILENRCHAGVAFYTCEQVLNGKSAALVVFTVSPQPGKFDVDTILPNGHASSDTDLFIRGDRWTYISNSADGKPHFRTENEFRGANIIHFEQFESDDGGKTWKKMNEGEERRQSR